MDFITTVLVDENSQIDENTRNKIAESRTRMLAGEIGSEYEELCVVLLLSSSGYAKGS